MTLEPRHKPVVYLLNPDKSITATEDFALWATWFEASAQNGSRLVGKTYVNGYLISTVFLGLDHGFGSLDFPALFETMVFKDQQSGETRRYKTYDEALEGHKAMVRWIESLDVPRLE